MWNLPCYINPTKPTHWECACLLFSGSYQILNNATFFKCHWISWQITLLVFIYVFIVIHCINAPKQLNKALGICHKCVTFLLLVSIQYKHCVEQAFLPDPIFSMFVCHQRVVFPHSLYHSIPLVFSPLLSMIFSLVFYTLLFNVPKYMMYRCVRRDRIVHKVTWRYNTHFCLCCIFYFCGEKRCGTICNWILPLFVKTT